MVSTTHNDKDFEITSVPETSVEVEGGPREEGRSDTKAQLSLGAGSSRIDKGL